MAHEYETYDNHRVPPSLTINGKLMLNRSLNLCTKKNALGLAFYINLFCCIKQR